MLYTMSVNNEPWLVDERPLHRRWGEVRREPFEGAKKRSLRMTDCRTKNEHTRPLFRFSSAALFFSLATSLAAYIRRRKKQKAMSISLSHPVRNKSRRWNETLTSLAAVLSAGFWFRLERIVARSAPTMPRWCLTALRLRFFATSSVIPFLWARRYTTVQAILRGFLRWWKSDSSLDEMKRKTLESLRT
jgi:hypothetical protein